MKVLVTGAEGFIGRNLVANIDNLISGKDKTRQGLNITSLYKVTRKTTVMQLSQYCRDCDIVIHLAGVNRCDDESVFRKDNVDFTQRLVDLLSDNNNHCPIIYTSSVQASLVDEYAGSPYGISKNQAEKILADYKEISGTPVYIYRLPNVFGKWNKPNYNSVVTTFCYNLSRDIPVEVNREAQPMELVYIDDLIAEFLDCMENKPHKCDDSDYYHVPVSEFATPSNLYEIINSFISQPSSLQLPNVLGNSFLHKLYATYLSYLPEEKIKYTFDMKENELGSFTELIKFIGGGQIAVNISKPGVTKGQHWHNTKSEVFVVVAGNAKVQLRNLYSDKIIEYEVSGQKLEALQMLPGYVHNLINTSKTEDLITLIWTSEVFDENHPDTFREYV